MNKSNIEPKFKMKDKFIEFACDFKNESVCEEELEQEGIELADIEREHFNEDEE